MLRDVIWSKNRSYRTKGENEPREFYLEGLSNSNRLDLLLGYFSSAAISVLSIGFANFLHNGGNLRLVINNILSDQDRNAILNSESDEIRKKAFDLNKDPSHHPIAF